MVKLKVTPDEALMRLRSVPHETFHKAMGRWHVDNSGNVRAQSVCWLFCWAKTGMGSDYAAAASQHVFNDILNITYERFDALVGHQWALYNRYKAHNIEAALERMLTDK